jgi:hypothetical protein
MAGIIRRGAAARPPERRLWRVIQAANPVLRRIGPTARGRPCAPDGR